MNTASPALGARTVTVMLSLSPGFSIEEKLGYPVLDGELIKIGFSVNRLCWRDIFKRTISVIDTLNHSKAVLGGVNNSQFIVNLIYVNQ